MEEKKSRQGVVEEVDWERRTGELNSSSVLEGMRQAWLDHRHCRDQTWKTVTVTVLMVGGFVALPSRSQDDMLRALAGGVVLLTALYGMLIAKHHRTYEIRKFFHIMKCQHWLKLQKVVRKDNRFCAESGVLYWPDDPEKLPTDFSWAKAFVPGGVGPNTLLFILRIHAFVFLFTAIFLCTMGWRGWLVLTAVIVYAICRPLIGNWLRKKTAKQQQTVEKSG